MFQQVYEDAAEKLYFYILGKTRSAYLAEEVTQITFVKLWQYRESLDEQRPLSLQLFRIARTTLIDLVRKQNHLSAAMDGLKNQQERTGAAIMQVEFNDTHQQLMQAINRLPPVRKKVFEMSRLEGLSYKEIAEALSISVKTVEKHVSQALKDIRPYLRTLVVIGAFLKEFIKATHE